MAGGAGRAVGRREGLCACGITIVEELGWGCVLMGAARARSGLRESGASRALLRCTEAGAGLAAWGARTALGMGGAAG